MYKFDFSKLEDGLFWHVRTKTSFGKLILKVLNVKKPWPPCWGNHDALVIKLSEQWFIGDVRPILATLTPIQKYLDLYNQKKVEIKIYKVKDAPVGSGLKAVTYWIMHINNTIYDFFAFPRLLFKAAIADLSNSKIKWIKKIGDNACGREWANWCTEGNATAWRKGAQIDVYGKPNPTPFTTEKRVGTTLIDITSEIIQEC